MHQQKGSVDLSDNKVFVNPTSSKSRPIPPLALCEKEGPNDQWDTKRADERRTFITTKKTKKNGEQYHKGSLKNHLKELTNRSYGIKKKFSKSKIMR